MSQEKPLFPISVKFEDGSVEMFDDVESLETGLEIFDSRLAEGCEARDALGRVVDLCIDERLELKRLALVE